MLDLHLALPLPIRNALAPPIWLYYTRSGLYVHTPHTVMHGPLYTARQRLCFDVHVHLIQQLKLSDHLSISKY